MAGNTRKLAKQKKCWVARFFISVVVCGKLYGAESELSSEKVGSVFFTPCKRERQVSARFSDVTPSQVALLSIYPRRPIQKLVMSTKLQRAVNRWQDGLFKIQLMGLPGIDETAEY